MKNSILVLLLLSFFTVLLNGQSKQPINLEKSQVIWEGSQLFGFGSHAGTIEFKKGHLIKRDESVVGGEFVIDMHSMKSSENDTWVQSLMDHLKGEDFFDVHNNPTARLVFSNVKHVDRLYLQITADLTINNVTNSVFFVAKYNDTKTQVETKFKIDRTDFNILYKSQGVTSIKDQIISDAIAFNVVVQL